MRGNFANEHDASSNYVCFKMCLAKPFSRIYVNVGFGWRFLERRDASVGEYKIKKVFLVVINSYLASQYLD